MGQRIVSADRDQGWLMPPSLREWLPQDHLAWFVIDTVGELDLTAAYRDDGQGRPAPDPAVMVALLVFSYTVRGAVLQANRAALRGGRRYPGGGREFVA